jgi:hypothetical protein
MLFDPRFAFLEIAIGKTIRRGVARVKKQILWPNVTHSIPCILGLGMRGFQDSLP